MSLFLYFGHEKVKGGGNNNNLEATKKDDDQSNDTGVSKSTAELAEVQEGSKKRFHTFQESWKTGRPWLEFHEKENAMFCSYCRRFWKNNLHSIVLPKLTYGLPIYASSTPELTTIQNFLQRCFKRKYISAKLTYTTS